MTSQSLSHNDYSVGWMCALSNEQTAAKTMLDDLHETLATPKNDDNAYTLGAIGKHSIVVVCLPEGDIGTNSAANVVTQMVNTFRSIRFSLMVGMGGGIPSRVRLGDIVVSKPVGVYSGVVQWDLGKETGDGFVQTGSLNRPPKAPLTALTILKSNHDMEEPKISQFLDELKKKYPKLVPKYTWSDRLKDPEFEPDNANRAQGGWWIIIFAILWRAIVALLGLLLGHGAFAAIKRNSAATTAVAEDERKPGHPHIYYSLIASGNRAIKDHTTRDKINESLGGHVLCVEMEAAGLMNNFPCLVIRGICDYADSRKNDHWQEYAAAIAAAYTKELLQNVQPAHVESERPVKDILTQVYDKIVATQENVTHIKSKMDKQEERKVLDWLTQTDYGQNHSSYLRGHQSGTGQWLLLKSEEFQNWLTASKHTFFCWGIPGAGKTILTSVVISHLNSKFLGDSGTGIAYIYFNFKNQGDQEIEKLLASVLKQLVGSQSPLPASTERLYDQHAPKQTRPSVEELERDLEHVASQYLKIFIIIDALDECEPSSLMPFISKLFDLQKGHEINIFATSRPIPEIMEHFSNTNNIVLQIRATISDVAAYIEGRLDLLPNVIRHNPVLREEIKRDISESVDGMFLLARIYLDLLQEKTTVNDVRRELQIFKNQTQGKGENQKGKVLTCAYEKAMERVNSQNEGLKRLAMEVLSWITFAKREITTSELQHALATRDGIDVVNYGDLPDLRDIAFVCAGLVTIDEDSHIIQLVHYTTQEYIT